MRTLPEGRLWVANEIFHESSSLVLNELAIYIHSENNCPRFFDHATHSAFTTT